ncbi:MAG TPA: ABC transporter ATP-binding protein [Acidimicrobiales bacterium]|nr:ABC transporter ATP-binding protein [Acidimicrobiales bacterium]
MTVPPVTTQEGLLEAEPPAVPAAERSEAVLSVRDLKVSFNTDSGVVKAVDGVSFDAHHGETVGIVGESGSGKSVTALAIMGLLPRTATVHGEVLYEGRNLLAIKEEERRKLRGSKIAIVFQDALAALNPVFKVGHQIEEAIAVHRKMRRRERRQRAVELLDLVGIPNAAKRVNQYPHEYSGGMRQRAMIAMAIANEPDVLIADEPTTALDVTIQAQVLEVLERIQDRTESTILLITHDLGVVAGLADRVLVMYAGKHVETASVGDVFYAPRHPYTMGLLASLPRLDEDGRRQRLHTIKGHPPSLINVPPGCAFHPRCPHAELPEPCSTDVPGLLPAGSADHLSACHFRDRLAGRMPVALPGGGAPRPEPPGPGEQHEEGS